MATNLPKCGKRANWSLNLDYDRRWSALLKKHHVLGYKNTHPFKATGPSCKTVPPSLINDPPTVPGLPLILEKEGNSHSTVTRPSPALTADQNRALRWWWWWLLLGSSATGCIDPASFVHSVEGTGSVCGYVGLWIAKNGKNDNALDKTSRTAYSIESSRHWLNKTKQKNKASHTINKLHIHRSKLGRRQ